MAAASSRKRAATPSRSQKKPQEAKSGMDNAKYKAHVSYYVDAAVKAMVKGSKLDVVNVLNGLTDLSEQGYRFAIEYDYRNLAYSTSLFCRNQADENAGLILAARHADKDKAILLLHYLHNEVFDGGVWPQDSPDDQYSW